MLPRGYCTVICAVPMTPTLVALTVAVPFLTPRTSACGVTLATCLFDDFQTTWAVMSRVLASLNVPVAVMRCVWPMASVSGAGVTAIDESVALVPVSRVDPEMLAYLAEIVAVPTASTDAWPRVPPALEMVATEVFDEDQVTVAVRSRLVPSEKVPVARNWTL